jgi:uncharacterized protein (TIGR02453 family)
MTGGDGMAYFDKRFFEFFEGLAMDNSKSYFDANRRKYQEAVREPFVELVGDMIIRIREHEPELAISPKDAMFRINRDIRFSKDKTPYKTHMAAAISRGGRMDHQAPGFYFHLGVDEAHAGGGVYMPDKDAIHKVRAHIMRDDEGFARAIDDPAFKDAYGQVQGDRLRRVPPEFKEAARVQPYVANKQWYYMTEMDPEVVLSDDLADTLMDLYVAGQSVAGFLGEALSR